MAATSTTDIISDLPDNVVENILMCLPIKDAVKTSLLSSKWRFKWTKIPQLVFDDTFFSIKSPEEQQLSKYKLLLAINQALLLHWAPILKFTLSISGLKSCPEIDQIILFLSRNGIEDFTLHIRMGECHKLPCHLFSCQQLRHLNLRSCVFQPPLGFRGFSKLTSVELEKVTFAADVIGSFISTCPLLERLTIANFTTSVCLEINAPNLKFLHIRGIFPSLCFKNTALLAEVLVGSHVVVNHESPKAASSNLIEVLHSLPCVENLTMGYFFFSMLLAAGRVPTRLPTNLNCLKYLHLIKICLMVMAEVSFALCMITSSPNLVKVIIQLHSRKSDADTGPLLDFMKAQDYSDVALNQLRELEMVNVSGALPELELIKLMLAKSPKLERVLIEPVSGADLNRGFNILKAMTRFQRASPKAEVIYLDPKK